MPTDLPSALSKSERKQLRTLALVANNPMIAATWSGPECERLAELGLAQRVDHAGFHIYSITDAGKEEAMRLVR